MADKIYTFKIGIEDRGQVAEEILRVDESLKKLNKTRKDAKAQLDKNKITQKEYAEILKKTKLKETELRTSKVQLAKADRNLAQQALGTKGSMERLRLETSLLIKEANKLNLATATGRKRFAELQKQVDKNKGSIRNFDRSMSGSKSLVGEYGRGIVSSFKSMAAGLVGFAAIIRVIKDLTQVTGGFDTATAKLASVTLQTREEIEDLTEQAKLLGATTIFTAKQVTELQIALAKLGFTAEEIQNSTAAVVDFATATGSDLGAAAKTAGIAVRAFGLDALESGYAVASLAIGTTKSALAFEDYETILGTVGPVAKAYGFTLEDTIALTGRLRDAGFDASKAATATRNILLNLADANGALAQKLGGSAGTLDELVQGLITLNENGIGLNETLELTDKRSVAAFSQFLEGAASVGELKDQVTDTRDELELMVDLQLDSYAGDVKALSSAWQGLILSMKASGALRGGIELLKNAILQVQNLDLAIRKFHKQTDDQLSRSFDLLGALTNKQGEHFDEMLEFFDAMSDEKLASRGIDQMAKDFALIRKVNKKEGEALANEYLARRKKATEDEAELQRIRNERIAADEEEVELKRLSDKAHNEEVAAEKRTRKAIAAKKREEEEIAKIEKQAQDKHDREVLQYTKKLEGDLLKLKATSASKIQTIEAQNAMGRIALMKQTLSAINAEEALSEEEKQDQLQRSMDQQELIRQAEYAQETVARSIRIEAIKTEQAGLAASLLELQSRLSKGDITKAFFDTQKEVIDASMENLGTAQTELETQQTLAAEQLENGLTAIKKKGATDRTAIEKTAQQEVLDTIAQSLQMASQINQAFTDLFETQKQKELSAVGDNAEAREAIEKKYAKKQQLSAITQAIINVALGVTKALSSLLPPFSYITAGITAAAGAIQIASIKNQKFAGGGVVQSGNEVPGMPRNGDNTLVGVKPGEVILNKGQQLALGGSDIFKRIGVPGFASGGVIGAPDPSVAGLSGGMDMLGLLNAQRVILNINELHDAEGELDIINETSEV